MTPEAFNQELLAWYRRVGRDLPWRATRDPYAIWVSEAMLQQTQVSVALPYYERWMLRFPTVDALARATLDEALACWQGLGYYRRCRMLHEGAKALAGKPWPQTEQAWRMVPGVGAYTAAALASICFGEASPVVDGNVERVFARFAASPTAGSQRRRLARSWGESMIDRSDPASWNQAIMELGALVCRPLNPQCGSCPVSAGCKAFASASVEHYPAANLAPPPIDVAIRLVVPIDGTEVGFIRAKEGQWWSGLWRFPYEDEAPSGNDRPIGIVRHTVTRHRLALDVSLRECAARGDLHWVDVQSIDALAIPSAMRKVWALVRRTLGSM